MTSVLTDLDINKHVSIFNNTITNIISNFVPNDIINFGDRDTPWMNRHIKNLDNRLSWQKIISTKHFYVETNSMLHLLTFNNLQHYLNKFIQKAKQNDFNKVTKRFSE